MTPYESQSIAIANNAFWASVVYDILAGLALAVAIIVGIIAYRTLNAILGQLKAAQAQVEAGKTQLEAAQVQLEAVQAQVRAGQWDTLITLEHEMANREVKFHEILNDMKKGTNSSDTLLLQERLNHMKQLYFNSVDRFASLVLNGQFSQSELKRDYQEYITNIVRTFPSDFQVGTFFRNIRKLHEKWEDDK